MWLVLLKSMNLKEIKWENIKEEILLTTEVNGSQGGYIISFGGK